MNNKLDKDYLDLVNDIIDNGYISSDRTGTGTKKLFGRQIRHHMKNGLPILTTKKIFTKGVIYELLWFLSGNTNTKFLVDNKVYIWVGDCYKKYTSDIENPISRDEFIHLIQNSEYNSDFVQKYATIGKGYGKQWRNFNGRDQIQILLDELRNNPSSRRLILNAWNVGELDDMLLVPCHYGFQLFTRELTIEEKENSGFDINETKYELSLMWNQRSVDTLLGLPFNILSYGLLLLMFSQQANMVPGELIGNLGDCHVYLNQIDMYLEKQKNNKGHRLPSLNINDDIYFHLNKQNNIFNYNYSDFNLVNYNSDGIITYPLSN